MSPPCGTAAGRVLQGVVLFIFIPCVQKCREPRGFGVMSKVFSRTWAESLPAFQSSQYPDCDKHPATNHSLFSCRGTITHCIGSAAREFQSQAAALSLGWWMGSVLSPGFIQALSNPLSWQLALGRAAATESGPAGQWGACVRSIEAIEFFQFFQNKERIF